MTRVMAKVPCPFCGVILEQRINDGEIVHHHPKRSDCGYSGLTWELVECFDNSREFRLVEIDPNRKPERIQ